MDSENNSQYNLTNDSQKQMEETFKAFVEAIIPRSPELAREYGQIQYYGAIDFKIDEYLIVTLNEYLPFLAEAVAQMLNIAAQKLVSRMENKSPLGSESGIFAALTPQDRLLALALLKKFQYTSPYLLYPYEGTSFYVTDTLTQLTMMGYYSEWFGYGTTRLQSPNERQLEFYPISWEQISYPGPTPPRKSVQNPL